MFIEKSSDEKNDPGGVECELRSLSLHTDFTNITTQIISKPSFNHSAPHMRPLRGR
jgi:hypothetical protein